MVEAVSRRNARRRPSRWLVALALSGLAVACDFDVHDIKLTQPSTKPHTQHAMDSGTPDERLDAGTQKPHATSHHPFEMDARVPPLEGDDSLEPGVTRPRKPRRSNSGQMSGGTAGGTAKQDARVGDETDAGTADRDAGTDDVDGGAEANDPCRNGTFTCDVILFTIKADNGNTVFEDGTVTVTVAGHSFSTQSHDSGKAELLLPVGRWAWLRVTADGYWTTEGPSFFFSGVPAAVNMYHSTEMIRFVQTVDETKGFVFVVFSNGDNLAASGNLPGAGLDLGRTSRTPFTNDATTFPAQSPTLLTGGNSLLLFPDVELGPLTLMPISPPGHSCVIATGGDLTFESKPMTMLWLQILCFVTTQ